MYVAHRVTVSLTVEPPSWHSANCGVRKGFVCKKDIGSDEPHPVPPTDPVPGYCPEGYFGVGKFSSSQEMGNPGGMATKDRATHCNAIATTSQNGKYPMQTCVN